MMNAWSLLLGGTCDQTCWLAEACKILLLLFFFILIMHFSLVLVEGLSGQTIIITPTSITPSMLLTLLSET